MKNNIWVPMIQIGTYLRRIEKHLIDIISKFAADFALEIQTTGKTLST